MKAEWKASLMQALESKAPPSSDFDLNPETQLPEDRVLREAAVLIGVRERNGRAEVLLTQRSSALKHHPGQIAFPGGKKEKGDPDLVRAALREAREEVGLPSDLVEPLGVLPCHETVTRFNVTPIVAAITGEFEEIPETGEVAEIFWVPLDHVSDPQNFAVQSRMWRGVRRRYYAVPFGPYYIWGATARMLRGLAGLMA